MVNYKLFGWTDFRNLTILILGKSGRFVKIKYLSYYVVGIKTPASGVYFFRFLRQARGAV